MIATLPDIAVPAGSAGPARAARPAYRIPFNKPCLTGSEMLYVANAIILGHSAGDGSYSRECHAFLERELGVTKALLTTSCTHALELAALLLEIQPGDEVIVRSEEHTSE